MNYPKLKFRIDKELDKKVASEFLNSRRGGIDFGQGIVKSHPPLGGLTGKSGTSKRLSLYSYVDTYYDSNREGLLKAQLQFSKDWNRISRSFFKEVEGLFDHFPWQPGQYICYLSIFDCNPRFLENKTFQVYYQKEKPVYTITHEMLHFIFYDYFRKNFPLKYDKISSQKIWDLSEIFNTLVLYLPQFRKITGEDKKIYYPAHQKLLPIFEKKFRNSKNIREFLESAL